MIFIKFYISVLFWYLSIAVSKIPITTWSNNNKLQASSLQAEKDKLPQR